MRLIVATSAGSNPDTVARIMANALTPILGQQVLVDNRAGAGGNIGAELRRARPPTPIPCSTHTPTTASIPRFTAS